MTEHQAEAEAEPSTPPPGPGDWPDPAGRERRPPARGVPLEMGGRIWMLASRPYAPELAALRDKLFDEAAAERKVDPDALAVAAATLLFENYDLSTLEAGELIGSAEPKALVDAVADAIMGPGWQPASWSDWVLSALIANGIRPADVPAPLLPYVLTQLVGTGRAVPADRFVHSLEFVRKRREMISRARGR